MEREEKLALALSELKGVGRLALNRLLEQAGSMENIVHLKKNAIIACLGKRGAENFCNQVTDDRESAMEELLKRGSVLAEVLKKEEIGFVSCASPEYPKRLRYIPDRPFGIYFKGRLPAQEVPTVAVIGARACSAYGSRVAYQFGKELAEAGIQVISGMARGIDAIGQEGVVKAAGRTFAVLGSGVDVCYPGEHRALYESIQEKGGIISEYKPGTKVHAGHFPERNRIISGLADIVLVIEARERSGTYITVTQALEQGREVYAVPGRVTDALSCGCNVLIRDGAGVAISTQDIMHALDSGRYEEWKNPRKSVRKKRTDVAGETGNTLEESALRKIIHSCLDTTPLNINEIYRQVTCNTGQIVFGDVAAELMRMEMDGLVEGRGNYYIAK